MYSQIYCWEDMCITTAEDALDVALAAVAKKKTTETAR